jgi:hypothetical protein
MYFSSGGSLRIATTADLKAGTVIIHESKAIVPVVPQALGAKVLSKVVSQRHQTEADAQSTRQSNQSSRGVNCSCCS